MFPPRRYATAAASREIPLAVQLFCNPPIPPRPPQENRAHIHELGQTIRIDQSEV